MVNYSSNVLIVVIILLAAVVPVVTFGFFSINEARETIETEELKLSREIISEQKEKINLFFTERKADISLFIKLPYVEKNIHFLFEENPDPEIKNNFKNLFSDIIQTYEYQSVLVFDNNLTTVLTIGHDFNYKNPIYDIANEDLMQKLDSGIYLSDVFIDPNTETVEMFVSVPLIHDYFGESHKMGYLVYEIDVLSFLDETLYEQILTKTGETVIAQQIGHDIYFVNKLRFSEAEPLTYTVTTQSQIALPAIESTSGISGYGITKDYRGQEILAAWDFSPMTRWGLVAKIDYNEALEPLNQEIDRIVIVVVSLTAASFIVGLVLSRKLTQPIKELQKATIQIIKKNYDQDLAPTGPIENKTIAKNFNAMIRSLKLSDQLAAKHLEELSRIDAQKGEFAAMASHELKTPLVPIKGYLEMLMEKGLVGEFNPKQNELLEKIYENTELLEKLILKILTAQRLGMGQMKWNISEFDVEDLMKNVYSDNQSLMKDKKIKFTNLCTFNQIVTSDYTQILQVFSNLIRNSVDFVTDNPEIEISAENKSDEILFYVKDNGIGMDNEHLEHLFKKFYQIDTSVRRKHGGTGLGLSICKGLVEGLGGKIWVESKLHHGSTFYFTISKDQSKLK